MMNSLSFSSSLLTSSTFQQPPLYNKLRISNCINHSLACSSFQVHLPNARRSLACATNPPQDGVVSVMNFEDLIEKDWSFLESDIRNSKEDHETKTDRIISAGNIVEKSKVLVSIGSVDFVDRLVETSVCQLLLVVHDSLLSLAGIKERHDKVKCWQGEFLCVPEKWAPFDVVFLYFLPALPFKLDEILEALASRCSPGARVVISHLQGRPALEQQRRQYPDVVLVDLPDKMTLEKVVSNHSFAIKEYVDDPSFYLAVLEMKA